MFRDWGSGLKVSRSHERLGALGRRPFKTKHWGTVLKGFYEPLTVLFWTGLFLMRLYAMMKP